MLSEEEMISLNRPIIIQEKHGLDMTVPEKTPMLLKDIVDTIGISLSLSSVRDLRNISGSGYMTDVIDSYRQRSHRMSLGRLLELFNSNSDRARVYNCISLELSKTA